jgi:hypothetical protein
MGIREVAELASVSIATVSESSLARPTYLRQRRTRRSAIQALTPSPMSPPVPLAVSEKGQAESQLDAGSPS